jgi:hypothetical protein
MHTVFDYSTSDLREWENHYSWPSYWEDTFWGTGVMKYAAAIWNDHATLIRSNAHKSKAQLKQIIVVNGNKSVYDDVQRQLLELTNKIDIYKDKYQMLHATSMVENRWFFDLYCLFEGYKAWFQKNILPPVAAKQSGTHAHPIKLGLNEIVLHGCIAKFEEIERELMRSGYLDHDYKWTKNVTVFCEFLIMIIERKYIKKAFTAQDFKIRRFFEVRYSTKKSYAAEMFKPAKRPTLQKAEQTFSFLPEAE